MTVGFTGFVTSFQSSEAVKRVTKKPCVQWNTSNRCAPETDCRLAGYFIELGLKIG